MDAIRFQLQFVDAIPGQADPATLNDAASDAIDELRARGYTVEPVDTGARGLPPFEIVLELAQRVHDNQSLLVEFAKLAAPIVGALVAWSQREAGRKPAMPTMPKPAQSVIVVQVGRARAELPAGTALSSDELLKRLLLSDPGPVTGSSLASTCAVVVQVPPLPPNDI